MMCADILKLSETLRIFEKTGIEYLHIDIMDGCFVPNFTLGTDYCKALKKATNIPLDIHLMINSPESKLDWFEFGEGDMVSVHAESTDNLREALAAIGKRGAKAYAALNPSTPVSALDGILDEIDGVLVMAVNPGFAGQKMIPSALGKITEMKRIFKEKGFTDKEIEVDGNVSFENAVKMREAGADIFVAGTSSIFSNDLPLEEGIAKFRKVIR